MRIILSRKGCDSATGGIPSPILPSGELYSLPIPERHPSGITYGDLQWGTLDWGRHSGDRSVGDLVQDLSRDRLTAADPIHLDPDLARLTVAPRSPHWKPAVGQLGAAARHLSNWGVTTGDLFLFFGWFRPVAFTHGRYAYVPRSPDQHIIFGWLQVQNCWPISNGPLPLGLEHHPHGILRQRRGLNHLYVASDRLHLPQHPMNLPGAAYCLRRHPALCLTAAGRSRSWWHVPDWMHPHGRRSTLSYHHRRDRWVQTEMGLLLKTVGRGQEFVLDCDDYPEAIAWVAHLLATASHRC
jgi:hypothetical protein